MLGFDKIPWWGKLIIIIGLSVIVYLSIWLIMVPFMKKKVESKMAITKSFFSRFNLLFFLVIF